MQLAIIGGTGYTGQELLRLLAHHPQVTLAMVCSRSQAGTALSASLPFLRGVLDMPFSPVDVKALSTMDLVISATPNGVAMCLVPELLQAGVRVIDLAADFRLRDAAVWQQVYDLEHQCSELLDTSVYGLTEWHKDALPGAQLVANPGCYATAMQLALLPFMPLGDTLALEAMVVDGKSGISGAGKVPTADLLFAHLDGNLLPYKIAGHRHCPEVLQQLRQHNMQAGLTFVPHLIPMSRGMLTTCYVPITKPGFTAASATQILTDSYAGCPFVDIMQPGNQPQTKSVMGTNMCRISATVQGNTLVLASAIDNLGKGAAGQAVQNLNLMFGLAETAGLTSVAVYP